MSSFLNRYLTEFDENLSGDSYIDPIGTLIIWSAFGRQVFSNRINSISNDVRNYTLNLFHHYLIRKLVNDDSVLLSKSLKNKYHGKDTLHFKQACLILLENLFVYSILRHENTGEVSPGGILGISKARRSWEKDSGKPTLRLTHEPDGHILVRQLGLGVSGRYKTPLMEIGFFDSSYNYNKPLSHQRWAAAEQFITGRENKLLAKLALEVYPFLRECVTTRSHRARLSFSDEVPVDLSKAYSGAFASPAVVGAYARSFWLAQTGLDSGAAGSLLQVLEADQDDELDARELLEQALEQTLHPTDQAKLQEISQLEPFLSDCALLFNLMAAERTHTVADVAAHWQRFGRDETRLEQLALNVSEHARLPAVKGSAAAQRLMQLQRVASAKDLDQQIRLLSEYHKWVMQVRRQQPWLSVDANGTIKVSARTLPRPAPADWPPGAWYNQYYLPQFKNFVSGMKGAME
ncbi:hypothetical protein [Pseudoduganella sp. GCM10020061]|uniref:hypothetical protein n=1 Tax=Pseudoduganella sp. GCM10020061 TaxID=3317345 RepID=UPI00362BE913